MKYIALFIALFGVVALASAGGFRQHQVPREDFSGTRPTNRFRRESEPQGSLVIRGEKPLSGPDRRPSLDIDYNRRIHDANGFNTNAYGGVNIRPGQPAQPHVGLNFEREYRNGFVGGFGQAQRGPGGRIDPSFGIRGGFRFRRDADEFQAEEEEY